MAYRLHGALVLVPTLIVVGVTCEAFGQSGPRIEHPGRVLDNTTRRPVSVTVKAWPEPRRTGIEGGCPLHGSAPIDQTTSGDNGEFVLRIEENRRTYTVVYCRTGYAPRVDNMPNDKHQTPVNPTPALIWPAAGTPQAALFDNEVRRRVIGALNDLAYLNTVDQKAFDRAISALADDFSATSGRRAEVIHLFSNQVRAWSE